MVAAGHRAISPPTPAPSPQPELRFLRLAGSAAVDELSKDQSDNPQTQTLSKHLTDSFPHLDGRSRLAFLTHLIDYCTPRELAHLSSLISPRLKVDFLAALPIEVSLHIISFLDDPKTLARASAVSRFWRSLVNDEQTWKVMCLKYRYRDYAGRLITHHSPSLSSSAAAAAALGLDTPDQSFERATGRVDQRSRRRRRRSSASSTTSSATASTGTSIHSDEDVPHRNNEDGHGNGAAAAAIMSSTMSTLPCSNASIPKSVLERLLDSYMARGLDAPSALSELRTLHELFLSKRARQVDVEERRRQLHALQTGSSTGLLQAPLPRIEATSMSDEDRRFYEELEAAVTEGRTTLGLDQADTTTDEGSYRPSVSPLNEAGANSASSTATTTAAGWLSSTKTPKTPSAPRIGGEDRPPPLGSVSSPRSNAAPSSIISPTGRLGNVTSGLLHSLWDRGAPRTMTKQDDGDDDESMDVDDETGVDSSFATAHSSVEAQYSHGGHQHQQPLSQHHGGAKRAGKARAHQESSGGGSSNSNSSNSSSGGGGSRGAGESRSLPMRSSRRNRPRNLQTSSSLRSHVASPGQQLEGSSSSSTPTLDSLGIGRPSTGLYSGQRQARAVTLAESHLMESSSSSMDLDAFGFTLAASTGPSGASKRAASATYARPYGPSSTSTINRRRGTPRKPFSYKTHFKLAYMTENNWLRGGRLLTQHVSSDAAADAGSVVTSLSIDDEWIVVGMANAKIHVFDVRTGLFVRTLEGHSSGIWCLSLISACKPRQPLAQPQAPQSPTSNGGAHGGGGGASSTAAHEGPSTGSVSSPCNSQRPLYNPTPDLNLIHHDPRPTASAFSPEVAFVSLPDSLPQDETHGMPRSRSTLGLETDSKRQQHSSSSSQSFSMHLGRGTGDFDSSPPNFTNWDQEQNSGDDAKPKTNKSRGAGLGSNFGSPCGSVSGFGNEGAIVVSGGCDRDVRVWDLTTGKCLHVLRGHNSTVRCLRVLEGRPLAISGSRDSTVRVWNIETGQLVHLLSGHLHSVRCLDVAGNKVVSASYDATCRIWDIDTGECLHVLRGHYHQIYAIAFDGVHVATGSLDSTARVWNAETGECLVVFQGHTSLVGQLQLSDNILITGGSDGKIMVFSLDTFTTVHQLLAHENSVTCLQFDDRFIVTGGNDGRVKLWDFRTGEFIRELSEPGEQVWKVSFRDDKCVVLCRRNDRTAMDVISFRPIEEPSS
ncbi:WD40 repeat-like protein [Acaromyces ingoldii]|uniref:WD40 repeat-like protein n=1 Tax=Acaromyces ingoldii TaxID=215250 RepID=A0A316YFC6_9BASI|nr:WD40 repeat-like protein [Acaromyces ingoldii]PWN87821.1 WD40 repeat-like protein [Acaromyces ingoldii]